MIVWRLARVCPASQTNWAQTLQNHPSPFGPCPYAIVHKFPNNKIWCILARTRFKRRSLTIFPRFSPQLRWLDGRSRVQADAAITDPALAAELKKKRTFRTFSYRGVELEKLLDMANDDFVELVHARARRRFQRGLKRKPMGLIKKLRKAKKEAPPNEKPAVVKTHLRDMIIVPEMIGSVIGIYNGKVHGTRMDIWTVG